MMIRILSAMLSVSLAVAASPLLDPSGTLKLGSIPASASSDSLVAIIASPGMPSIILGETYNDILTYNPESNQMICKGATLQRTSTTDRIALALCAHTAPTIIVEGVTNGDVQSGVDNSRHARTLTAIFRASSTQKTRLILVVSGEEEIDQEILKQQVKTLYDAVVVEQKNAMRFHEAFDLQVVAASSSTDAPKILALARNSTEKRDGKPLSEALMQANEDIRKSGVTELALDPPNVASAYLTLGTVASQLTRRVQAQLLAWKRRTARGLSVDDLGETAAQLRGSVLAEWDSRTRAVTGWTSVASYRREIRQQLIELMDGGITSVFEESVEAIKAAALKRLQKQLIKTVLSDAEMQVETGAQALREQSLIVETTLEKVQVPSLGLTKENVIRGIIAELNNAVMTFSDSPSAKILRMNQVKKVVNKEKKPGERSVELGLDLVAMLRPDGFGSLQGFVGYNLPGGNSITFGVHNDADDPQTISQFGGVRPPLLRVQPKLKVNVEM